MFDPQEQPETQDIKIVALMSVPMCGWNPHWGCTTEAMRPFGIPIRLHFGAYWHQGMSNLFEDVVAEGIDWVLVFDYDTLATPEQLSRLMAKFGSRPDIDALAALQCKRGTDEVPLLTAFGQREVEITGEPFKVDTAHFGMTLLRVEAIKKVPMPWFMCLPDENGSYKTLGRVDSDIFYWRKWEKAGNSLYVDPSCAIGHLQPTVAVFDENLKPKHIHYVDWRKANRTKPEPVNDFVPPEPVLV